MQQNIRGNHFRFFMLADKVQVLLQLKKILNLIGPMSDKKNPDLVSRDNVTRALRLDKLGLEFLSPPLYRLFGLERANTFYHKHAGLPSHEFIDALFDDLNVKVNFSREMLEKFPKEGPFWLIANHPLGIWDGLVLMKLLKEARPDFKVITMFFLERLHELRPHIIPVNNWHDKKDIGGNHSGMKEMISTLRQGHPVGLFPGGSVARFTWRFQRITDPEWNPTSVKMLEKFQFPIVPVFISGRNSRFFYIASFLSATLRRGRNFGEFFNKKGKAIEVTIGEPIYPENRPVYKSPEEFGKILRQTIYQLRK